MQSLFAIEHCLVQHIKSDGGMYPEVYMFEQEMVLSLMENTYKLYQLCMKIQGKNYILALQK